MSAFVVIVGNGDAAIARSIVEREEERAPDGIRAWSEPEVAFGHATLALSGGLRSTQVLTRNGITVVADARIDDAETTSDADAIMQAYDRWGADAPAHLTGDFAFAVYDSAHRRLVCARDFLGIRPLFYAELDHLFVVASSIDMIRAHPRFREELLEESMVRYLAGSYADVPETTFYRGIRRLRPGSVLLLENGARSVRRSWELDRGRSVTFRRHDDYVDHFLEVFDRAVADRLRGPSAAVLMSGGLDSTSVAATARHVRPELKIDAYTTNFSSLFRDDEASYATVAARALRLEHHVVKREREELFANASTYTRAEPFEDPLADVFLTIAQRASRHARVLLDGLGGDTLFRTSSDYFRDLVRRGRLVRITTEVAAFFVRRGTLPPLALRSWIREAFGRREHQAEFPEWMRPDVARRFGLRDDFERSLHRAASHPRRPEAARYVFDPFWSRYFETWDPSETRLPIECTHPILDRRVVETLFSYPPMPWFADKYLLRAAMHDRLPDSLRLRRKTLLAGDPLHLAVEHGMRTHEALIESMPILRDWIDVPKLLVALERGSDLRAVLPLTLAKWWQARAIAAR